MSGHPSTFDGSAGISDVGASADAAKAAHGAPSVVTNMSTENTDADGTPAGSEIAPSRGPSEPREPAQSDTVTFGEPVGSAGGHSLFARMKRGKRSSARDIADRLDRGKT